MRGDSAKKTSGWQERMQENVDLDINIPVHALVHDHVHIHGRAHAHVRDQGPGPGLDHDHPERTHVYIVHAVVSIDVAPLREGVDLPELRDFKGSLLPRSGVQAQTRCTLEECDPEAGAEAEQGAGAGVEEGEKAGVKVHIPGETAVRNRGLDRIHLIPGDGHPVLRVGTIRVQ